MNVVDASAWLEYFADGPNADAFAEAIEATGELIVPVITLYEVLMRVLQQRGEDTALQAVAIMQQGRVVELGSALALSAARIGASHRLPLADSLIYATALDWGALLWTQDSDFQGLASVAYRAKPER